MKHIIDFYENDLAATPANTMGIGNPVAPTDTTVGTEPLDPKYPKNKKKKKDCKVSEGILSGVDASLNAADEVIEFAQWFVNQWVEYVKIDVDAALESLVKAIRMEGKDTVVIDEEIANSVNVSKFMPDRMYIVKALPKNIRTIKFINAKWGVVDINAFIGDLSNLNVEVYKDNERTFADLHISFKMANAGKDIMLGKIICDKFQLTHPKMETLKFSDDSIMLEVVIDSCEKLQNIYGKFRYASSAKLPRNYIVYQLCQSGVLPWGIKLNIYG